MDVLWLPTASAAAAVQGLTDAELLQGVKTAWDRGWLQVKLYFMVGLPGERDEDVLGIAETVRYGNLLIVQLRVTLSPDASATVAPFSHCRSASCQQRV
jgi:radical SAM superfamily enzyme YgiQ (UPF0313 family)